MERQSESVRFLEVRHPHSRTTLEMGAPSDERWTEVPFVGSDDETVMEPRRHGDARQRLLCRHHPEAARVHSAGHAEEARRALHRVLRRAVGGARGASRGERRPPRRPRRVRSWWRSLQHLHQRPARLCFASESLMSRYRRVELLEGPAHRVARSRLRRGRGRSHFTGRSGQGYGR